MSCIRDLKQKCCTSSNIGLVVGDKSLCHNNCFETFWLFCLESSGNSSNNLKLFLQNSAVQVIIIRVADVINVDKIISKQISYLVCKSRE